MTKMIGEDGTKPDVTLELRPNSAFLQAIEEYGSIRMVAGEGSAANRTFVPLRLPIV